MLDTKHFKKLLEKEVELLESELSTIGRKNPDNPSDWEAVEKNNDRDTAEDVEVADSMEEFEVNRSILTQLEIRLNETKNALIKIEKGNYGICEKGGEPIEEDRLEANPSATTCKKHMGE
ncbi:MAG: TraR/DksA C4-type zinc finger protein [Minisyncoccia bacterium]